MTRSCPICNRCGSNLAPAWLRPTRNGLRPTGPVDNSSNDDGVRRQQDQDNLQQSINTQQMINNQQMQNDQQQQQIVNDMNR